MGRILNRGLLLAAILFTSGCAGTSPSAPAGADPSGARPAPSGQAASAPAAPKRVVTAIMGVPANFQSKVTGPGRSPGYDALEAMVSAGLTAPEAATGGLRGQLAEAAPSLENGLWKLMPDGRMETTWRIRKEARWQDGTSFTSDDVAFSATVFQDRDLPNFRDPAYEMIDRIETPDAQTVVISWSKSFIEADRMFSELRMVPIPKHILAGPYAENKENFLELAYWRDELVGSGPYRLKEWSLGSHVLLTANELYVLGKPKIDSIEVRFISDPSTLVANMLAGDVDASMGRGLSLEQAAQLRERWGQGKVEVAFESWIALYPQMLNPNPAVLAEVPFRRALLHAIDRQELVSTLQHGLVPVAHVILGVNEPEYPLVDPAITKYEFDPRRSAQLIEGLGYTKGADGAYRDPSGQRLQLEIRTTGGDVHEKAMLAVADSWQQLGAPTEVMVIARARANDRPWRHTRPAFELQRQPNDMSDIIRYHSSQAPVPENNFTGSSKHRYMNAEMDSMIDRYFATIPLTERNEIVVRIMQHLTDRVVPLPLFYDANPMLVSSRLIHAGPRKTGATEAWNVEAWDVQ